MKNNIMLKALIASIIVSGTALSADTTPNENIKVSKSSIAIGEKVTKPNNGITIVTNSKGEEIRGSNSSVLIGHNSYIEDPKDGTDKINTSVVIGNNAKATIEKSWQSLSNLNSNSQIAIGNGVEANGQDSFAMGHNSTATSKSIALGLNNVAGTKVNEKETNPTKRTGNGSAIAIGVENIATGGSSKAIGKKNETLGGFANAFGDENYVGGKQATAVGYKNTIGDKNKKEGGDYSIALGNENIVHSKNSYALGQGNDLLNKKAKYITALGFDNKIDDERSVALGNENHIVSKNAIAIGNGNKLQSEGDIAIGNNVITSQYMGASVTNAIAIGNKSISNAYNSIALGYDAQAKTKDGIAIGSSTRTDGFGAIVIGKEAKANNSIAIGESAEANGSGVNRSVAIGYKAFGEQGSVVIGDSATTGKNGNLGVVIGQKATGNGQNLATVIGNEAKIGENGRTGSIALGAYSVADRSGNVIGYDAATNGKADLYGKLSEADKVKYDAAKDKLANLQKEQNQDIKKLKELQAIKVDDRTEDQKAELKELNTKLNKRAGEINSAYDGVIKYEATWQSTLGELAIGDTAKGYTRQITGVAAGFEDTDAVNVAQLKSEVEARKDGDKALEDKLSAEEEARKDADGKILEYTSQEIDKNKVEIENNKDAIVQNSNEIKRNAIKNDAKNREQDERLDGHDRQIQEVQNVTNHNASAIEANTQRINHLNKKLEKGLAASAAMAGIEFLEINEKELTVGAAVGSYSGEQAVAVGVQGAPTENTRVHGKVSMSSGRHTEAMVSVGASWKFNFR